MVNVRLNGEEKSLSDNMTVMDLLLHLELPRTKVAVELNREIVPKSTFDEVIIQEGDRLEIVHFIGGG